MLLKIGSILIGSLLLSFSALADVLDVADADVFKKLEELQGKIDFIEDQYYELQDQTTELKKHSDALTNAEDFQDYFNVIDGVSDFWDWTPSVAELEDMNSAGLQAGKLKDRLKYYEERYGEALTAEQFNEDYDTNDPDSTAALQAEQAASSRFSLAMSQEAFDRTEDFQDAYDKQFNKLKSVDSVKKATDMSNQLQLQLTQMMNEMLKLQAKQVEMQALLLKEFDTENEFNDRFFKISTNP